MPGARSPLRALEGGVVEPGQPARLRLRPTSDSRPGDAYNNLGMSSWLAVWATSFCHDLAKVFQRPWRSPVNRLLSVTGAFGVLALGFGALPVMASTTTFNVPCGKIALLEQAVGTPGATVNLASGCTYHLTREFWSPTDLANDDELPVVTGALTINGHGSVLQGIPTSSPLCCGRILEVDGPGTLTLNSLTLSGGRLVNVAQGGGGLFVVNATAILNGSVVKNNLVECPNFGGGCSGGGILINQGGTLRLNNSQVLGNAVPDVNGGAGGGIDSFGTLSLVNNSRVSGNHTTGAGAGIWATGTVTISNSSVTGNRITATMGSLDQGPWPNGGGIAFSGGTLTLYKALVAGNSISNPKGTFWLYNSEGGGIFVVGYTSPCCSSSVLINQSQISNNTAETQNPRVAALGGGLYNAGGRISLSGSTVNGNVAVNNGGGSADGGGIFNDATGEWGNPVGTVSSAATTVISNSPDNWS